MLQLSAPAIVCAARGHGETGVIVRLMTEAYGLVGGFVAGGRGRNLRPIVIPGNRVEVELSARSDSQLPSARLELVASCGPWLGEPLASAGIGWATTLTARSLPERHAYPALWSALSALLDAICMAPSARGWAAALAGYEALLLREMGFGGVPSLPDSEDFSVVMAMLERLGPQIARHSLADRRSGVKGSDVMGARTVLMERLSKIG
ncbi:MAG: recombination protein O N-terminal domain-containing protein [Novosphingobium sp.]